MEQLKNNYRKLREIQLAEYDAAGIQYRHIGTGCEIFHVECDDEENVFAFIFPTPPPDSSGLPHIIEHSVLSGSKQFPVKDPFAQLMQGSMHTFLNAMTFPDKTIYPAASLVENDFFNLLRVYADAVFFPLLQEEIFLQEGHHLHTSGGGIRHSGVVYNEMKGNYSSIESIAGEWTTRSLFDRSAYRFDSGGEPEEIAGLTYADFLEYYRAHYHPSNGKFYCYGNIPAEKILSFLHREVFRRFDTAQAVSLAASEPKWEHPRRFKVSGPASGRKEAGKEDMLFLNWLTDPVTGPLHLLSMEVLAEILLGNQGAPLYQRIVESGIAEDVSPVSGLTTHLFQAVLTAGIRGTSIEKEQEFENLVLSTLRDVTAQGIPKQVIEGSMNRVEFRNREKRGGVPFGLRLLIRGLRGWLHGLDPDVTMRFSPWFGELRKQYKDNSRYFENLIDTCLIRNNHRSTVLIQADTGYTVREAVIDEHSPAVAERAERETALFNAFQEKTDKPEDVAAIPLLKREDIPREVELIPTREAGLRAGGRLYTHALNTNGIVYLDIGFPVDNLTAEEQFFMTLFSSALYKIGCDGLPYDELSRTLFEETGGLTSMLEGSTTRDGTKLYLFFRIKTLETKFERGLALLEKILTTPDSGRTDKIRDILLETRNDISASVVPRGNQYAMLTAARNFQAALGIEEIWKGVDQLFFLHRLSEIDAAAFSGIEEVFIHLRRKVLHSAAPVLQITAEENCLDTAAARAEALLRSLPPGPESMGRPGFMDTALGFPRLPQTGAKPVRLAVPAAVGFAGAVLRASWLGTRANALETLLGHALKTGYLWEQVRMKGGAYGVSAGANGSEGIWSFTSYRDPRCGTTLGTFRDALAYAASGSISGTVLNKAVIGTVGNEVKKLTPGIKGFIGFRRKLYGITDEARQNKRDWVLSAAADELKHSAEWLLHNYNYGETALIADEKTLSDFGASAPIIRLPV
jgi:presequence protease